MWGEIARASEKGLIENSIFLHSVLDIIDSL